MALWHWCWPKVLQIQARAKPKPRLFAASTPSMAIALLNHFISSIYGPMSDTTMWRRLCVADFGHVMSSLHWCWPNILQIQARANPKPREFAARTPSMALLNHFISSIWIQ
jgi:hypothetical protein